MSLFLGYPLVRARREGGVWVGVHDRNLIIRVHGDVVKVYSQEETYPTVRTHVWHIYRKLQVHNRTEAILKGAGPRSTPARDRPRRE